MLSATIRPIAPIVRPALARTFASGLDEVVIVSVARTPIGSMGGALSSLSAPALGSAAIKAAVERAGLSGEDVDEAFIGNVCSAGVGQAPARQAILGAGLPLSVPCTTINKVCASGMKSVMFAAQAVATGGADVVVAGGMESMSSVPYYLPGGRNGMKYGHGKVEDGLVKDGLFDVYNQVHMGVCAEKCASDFGFTREEQDAFAIASYTKAAAAAEAGHFKDEIVPVEITSRGKTTVVDTDEEFSRVNFEKVPTLKPPFKADGSVTAANASSLNDGAAALIITSRAKAEALGMNPIARIRGFGDAAHEPENFTTAPAKAVPVAMQRAGVTASDLEYHEINEAFANVVLANMQLLDLDPATVNVWGGAVALGHPIGVSGARILVTLLSVLAKNDATLGSASICNGGGGASAMVLERL